MKKKKKLHWLAARLSAENEKERIFFFFLLQLSIRRRYYVPSWASVELTALGVPSFRVCPPLEAKGKDNLYLYPCAPINLFVRVYRRDDAGAGAGGDVLAVCAEALPGRHGGGAGGGRHCAREASPPGHHGGRQPAQQVGGLVHSMVAWARCRQQMVCWDHKF